MGRHGVDTIHLAKNDYITIPKQAFAQILNFTDGFFGDCSDNLGHLGLGLSDVTPYGYNTVLHNLKLNDAVKNKVVSLYLDGTQDGEAGDEGLEV